MRFHFTFLFTGAASAMAACVPIKVVSTDVVAPSPQMDDEAIMALVSTPNTIVYGLKDEPAMVCSREAGCEVCEDAHERCRAEDDDVARYVLMQVDEDLRSGDGRERPSIKAKQVRGVAVNPAGGGVSKIDVHLVYSHKRKYETTAGRMRYLEGWLKGTGGTDSVRLWERKDVVGWSDARGAVHLCEPNNRAIAENPMTPNCPPINPRKIRLLGALSGTVVALSR